MDILLKKINVSDGRRAVAGTGLISQRIIFHPRFESESSHHLLFSKFIMR